MLNRAKLHEIAEAVLAAILVVDGEHTASEVAQ
jgi:hypothetical protein